MSSGASSRGTRFSGVTPPPETASSPRYNSWICRSGKKASELVGECKRYPQVLINVPVADKAKKEAVLSAPALQSAVAEQEEKLAGNGRVLVRPSGTEALIRVMVEAQTEPVARETAELLANVIKNRGS